MVRLLVSLTLLTLAAPAWAITCSFTGITPVSFGTYDPSNPSPTQSTGRLLLDCERVRRPETVQIQLSGGDAGSPTRRALGEVAGTATLRYNLYRDAARSLVWGDSTGGAVWRLRPGHPAWLRKRFFIPVYGELAAGQNVPVGAYRDTILVTLIY